MNAIQRIQELMDERNWSPYRLAVESGLSSSTIANIFRRNTVPSLITLEAICNAFGISLSQFFSENAQFVELSSEQMDFFREWLTLTNHQKALLYSLIKEFK